MLRLADVRVRLELFLNALFGAPIPVSAAEPAAPVSWLARLAGRAAMPVRADCRDRRRSDPPAAASSMRPAAPSVAFQLYLLLAVEQAVRLARGSATIDLGIENDEMSAIGFSIAEAAAVDDWIVLTRPGLVPALRAARRAALTQRAQSARPAAIERAIERASCAHSSPAIR